MYKFTVFLDDDRNSKVRIALSKRYDVWISTAHEAITLLKTNMVSAISLDHDLGDEEVAGSGYQVAKWIEEAAFNNEIDRLECYFHSANPVGVDNMTTAIDNAYRYWDNKKDSEES